MSAEFDAVIAEIDALIAHYRVSSGTIAGRCL